MDELDQWHRGTDVWLILGVLFTVGGVMPLVLGVFQPLALRVLYATVLITLGALSLLQFAVQRHRHHLPHQRRTRLRPPKPGSDGGSAPGRGGNY